MTTIYKKGLIMLDSEVDVYQEGLSPETVDKIEHSSPSENLWIGFDGLSDKSSWNALGHITTDKPIYKPNDVAFIEVYVIDSLTKEPVGNTKYVNSYFHLDAQMSILDSFNNEIYKSPEINESHSTFVFTYKVPKNAKGGEYKIKIASSHLPTSFRKFRIN